MEYIIQGIEEYFFNNWDVDEIPVKLDNKDKPVGTNKDITELDLYTSFSIFIGNNVKAELATNGMNRIDGFIILNLFTKNNINLRNSWNAVDSIRILFESITIPLDDKYLTFRNIVPRNMGTTDGRHQISCSIDFFVYE